ncbi:MAG: UDP-N-acetylglucosamine 1-carboxyvinyltransferase [bacterium]|nr:UDP-N-acetylglucosamine 1-carboxyvinyltransferase [bacterium]
MPDKFLIKGGVPLVGEVEISGYKNSAGACLAATLLSENPSVIDNLPLCSDVLDQIEILKEMGASIEWQGEKRVKISPKNIDPEKIPVNLFEKIRVSILLVGPLLARFRKLKIPHPGGDKIGLRPINTLLEALKEFGVKVEEKKGFYCLETPENLVGKRIVLKEFSVSATEIIMMLAALAEGETKIELAAAEPQVQDLGNLLIKMGLKVEGIGAHTILINGQGKLNGAEFAISPDLLEVGTFLIGFAVTGGQGKIKNVNPEHLIMFLGKMKEIGVDFELSEKEILVRPCSEFRPTKIQVLPFPGFPTDLQPQTSILATQAKGRSLIHDPLYENRFQHLHELRKMGADIEITDPHRALIFGKTELQGAKVDGSDIRAGAALILAGLLAKGETVVSNAHLIDRGYERLEEKLKTLGAKIERI